MSSPAFFYLRPTSVAVILKPDLSGLAHFELIPEVKLDRFELEGTLALEAGYDFTVRGTGVRVYVGGEPSVAFQIPGDLFKQMEFRAFAGCRANLWAFQIDQQHVFVVFTYASSCVS